MELLRVLQVCGEGRRQAGMMYHHFPLISRSLKSVHQVFFLTVKNSCSQSISRLEIAIVLAAILCHGNNLLLCNQCLIMIIIKYQIIRESSKKEYSNRKSCLSR